MPDVSRSDSNRSDASRPRVSFNRDVHVKRINGPRTGAAYTLASDGSYVPTSVQRENPKTKRQMTKEAEKLLKQVDKIKCSVKDSNVPLEEKPKRKNSFLKKKKESKNSSGNDSTSSNEYRVYRVTKKEENPKDFMSLDRKKYKKEKNKSLDYLSLERDDESFSKEISKERSPPIKVMASSTPKISNGQKPKPKLHTNLLYENSSKKKQLSPIIEIPSQMEYEVPKSNKVGTLVKKLSNQKADKVRKNLGSTAVKQPMDNLCHNNNLPFSYTVIKNELNQKTNSDKNLDGNTNEDLKSTSPTNDVIYAQVVVSGRGRGSHKTTIHTRVPRSGVGVEPTFDSNGSDGIYQSLDELKKENSMPWKNNSDFVLENRKNELFGENPGRRDLYRRSSDSSRYSSPSPSYERTSPSYEIKIAPKYDRRSKSYENSISTSKLNDLSIRREILLSRIESQARERYNSLKRLQEPNARNNKLHYIGNDIRVNETFGNNIRKLPKDVELIDSKIRNKRESKYDSYMKEKESWKKNEKVHRPQSPKGKEILNRLSKIGKSKSFIEEGSKPRTNKMDKVKMLFRKKKENGEKMSSSEDDPLTSRYTEYRGSDVDMSDLSRDASPRRRKLSSDLELSETDYGPRKRLPTPNSSRGSNDSITKMTKIKNQKNRESTPTNWFKSLDRLTKKGKQKNKIEDSRSELSTSTTKPQPSLRFFGDTDQESLNLEEETTRNHNIKQLKDKYGLNRGKIDSDTDTSLTRCNSRLTDSTLKGSASGLYKYDLDKPDYGLKQMRNSLARRDSIDYATDSSTIKDSNYEFNVNGLRYGPKVQRSLSSVTHRPALYEPKRNSPRITITKPDEGSLSSSRRVKSHNNLYRNDEIRRARRLYDSSADSATDGDASHKSTVYLHAATVGDIPGPKNIYKSERRSQSREELSSIGGSSLSPQTRTISRSFSVLAPWRPKHRQDTSLHYQSGTTSELGKGKPPSGQRTLSRDRKTSELHFNTLGKENRRQKDLLR